MDGTSDALATWGWGLRRYAWVVVVCVVGVGILLPTVMSRSGKVYQAQAQVGPTKQVLLPNLDPLPRFAESVFDNGAVAGAVRRLLRLPANAAVVPDTVQLTTAQDNPVMVVSGKSSKPATAVRIADTAAASFVVQLNKYSQSVGTFAVQKKAQTPAKPVPKFIGGRLAVVVGLLAGLVGGCGLVGLIVVLRRPVVGSAAAQSATGLPVLARLPLRSGAAGEGSVLAMRALCRRLLAGGHEVVLVAGTSRKEVQGFCTDMKSLLANAHVVAPTETLDPGSVRGARSSSTPPVPEIVALDPTSSDLWVDAPDGRSLTLLLVPEGIRSSVLRRIVDQYASGTHAALALVTGFRPAAVGNRITQGRPRVTAGVR